jgi:LPS-assembly protein
VPAHAAGARHCIAALAVVLAFAAAADELGELSEQLKQEPFELTADALHYDIERELYVGRGNVVIKQSGRTLHADWVAFNRKTGAGVASGSVKLEDSGDVVTADFVEFELETIQGTLHGARLESQTSRFRASAAEIAKTGPKTYSFKDGRFTTCRCPDPEAPDPWVLRSEEAKLEVEGYATARNTTFDVFGVPIAWIPWMIFPVKTERQTGVLFPEFSLGSFHGLDMGLPFFWAITDQSGLVLTPRYSTKRGPGGAARFDYVQGERTEGETLVAYYFDQEIDSHSPKTPFSRDRWSASGTHEWYLPEDFRFETNYMLRVRQRGAVRLPRAGGAPRRPLPRVGGDVLALGRADRPRLGARRHHLLRRPPEPRQPRPRPLPAPARADRERRRPAGHDRPAVRDAVDRRRVHLFRRAPGCP